MIQPHPKMLKLLASSIRHSLTAMENKIVALQGDTSHYYYESYISTYNNYKKLYREQCGLDWSTGPEYAKRHKVDYWPCAQCFTSVLIGMPVCPRCGNMKELKD